MFEATRDAGLAGLEQFVPNAGKAYASNRNFDYGTGHHNNVSTLSPWIRHRLITEDDILKTVLSKHSFKASEKYVMEVFWRAYFKGWLEQHPDIWPLYCDELHNQTNALAKDKSLNQTYQEAINGETGIDCFDHWAQELVETGYLHNHARMWFASIWIFTLKLPWVLGANFFYKHLLDGDPASNTLSWRWVGGLHTKGKHYVARASNIEKFTEGRFNPAGQLDENPQSLSEDWVVNQTPMPLSKTPNPNKKIALLITDEDCSLESKAFDTKTEAIFLLNRDLSEYSQKVQDFKSAALQNVGQRASKKYGLDVIEITVHDFAEQVSNHQIEQIVSPYLPVGPVAELIAGLRCEEALAECEFVEILHSHDEQSWPFATRGFFKLKKKIPLILSQKGL